MLLKNLDNILPEKLTKLSISDLDKVAQIIRHFIVDHVKNNGGHIGSSLGVVELTLALHSVFNLQQDKIIWDTGHQCYAHKILTGRAEKFSSVRKKSGISGFPSIFETSLDVFGTGHAGTALAALYGFSLSNIINDYKRNLIAVVGDGAWSSGSNFEGLNNLSTLKEKNIIIINDNDMFISDAVGGFSEHFFELRNRLYPESHDCLDRSIEELLSDEKYKNNIFTDLGFSYIGVLCGHDISAMKKLFSKLKDCNHNKTIVVHIFTEKSRGYKSQERIHALSYKSQSSMKNLKGIVVKKLSKFIKIDKKVCALTPAMLEGSGLSDIKEKFPDRIIDVGIAEQCSVTTSAALALDGVKVFCCIYSTFLQRAYDQVIHDTALQNAPVKFLIDRAGFVGHDGATHQGFFDIAFLRIVPNFICMSPRDDVDLELMLDFAYNNNDHPIAIRYPKKCFFNNGKDKVEKIKLGKAEVVKRGNSICIISFGHVFFLADEVVDKLELEGLKPTLINARFVKPIDKKIFKELAENHDFILTIEAGCEGGFGSVFLEFMNSINYKGQIKNIVVPDKSFDHATTMQQFCDAGMTVDSVMKIIKNMYDQS